MKILSILSFFLICGFAWDAHGKLNCRPVEETSTIAPTVKETSTTAPQVKETSAAASTAAETSTTAPPSLEECKASAEQSIAEAIKRILEILNKLDPKYQGIMNTVQEILDLIQSISIPNLSGPSRRKRQTEKCEIFRARVASIDFQITQIEVLAATASSLKSLMLGLPTNSQDPNVNKIFADVLSAMQTLLESLETLISAYQPVLQILLADRASLVLELGTSCVTTTTVPSPAPRGSFSNDKPRETVAPTTVPSPAPRGSFANSKPRETVAPTTVGTSFEN